jgi:hypothetical protein
MRGVSIFVRRKLLTLAGKIVFRIVFAAFIVLESIVLILLLWLLLWGISHFLPEDNAFVIAIGFVLILISPFLVGASSYLIFQRMTRVQYVHAESERWLAERSKLDAHPIRRRNRFCRWAIWIPVGLVVLYCVFLDETWPPTSQLFHPRSGRLIGYRVTIPLRWTVILSEPDDEKRDRTYFYLNRWEGMLRGGINPFLGYKPSMTSSSINCSSTRSPGSEVYSSPSPSEHVIRAQKYSMDSVTLGCTEFRSRDQWTGEESHIISCLTMTRDFSCYFAGKEDDVADVYMMMQSIKRK